MRWLSVAEFEIHVDPSALFGSEVTAGLGCTWGSFASDFIQDFMERRKGRC